MEYVIYTIVGIIVIAQLSLAVYALIRLYKQGCVNLNPPLWTIIILFCQFLGPILFLTLGLKKDIRKDYGDEYDD